MLLLIDNFDSFSHILADYFRQTGESLKIVRNDVTLDELKKNDYDGLILSPGPETPEKAGNLMLILSHYHDKIPVLGVCLGHQAIGVFFGAELQKGLKPVHGKVHIVHQKCTHALLDGIPDQFQVTRYHSLELRNIPECLEVLLETRQGEVMAVVHKQLPIMGIQYHPEAHLSQYGHEIIKNWLRFRNQVANKNQEPIFPQAVT